MMTWVSIAASLAAAAGCVYLVLAMVLVGRFARRRATSALASAPGVTILKPLHGADPSLFDNLASFCVQDYPGQIQIICGVADPNDPAVAVVKRLREAYPGCALDLVVDATVHGSNRKVSNLINTERRARHDIIVLADSDMRVNPDYLVRVVAALQEPGITGVTCLYYETAARCLGSQLSALGVNAHFLPSVLVGLGFGRAQPCFGSTITLRRTTLDAIGGFACVADCLADDYALGRALCTAGGRIAIPPFAIAHVGRNVSARKLWDHELRWARTVRTIDPIGYAGSVITHPLAFGVIAALAGIGSVTFLLSIGLVCAAVVARSVLLRRVEQAFELPEQTYWLIPLRDLFSFVVFLVSFLGRGVSWGGHHYRVVSDGTLVPDWRSPRP